ncbi:MAG: hypothetical protein OXD54_00260 [Candidatus Poribacteria bacterium]|nr:hypothetical protein [Candidatus Poribacteria bacterium]
MNPKQYRFNQVTLTAGATHLITCFIFLGVLVLSAIFVHTTTAQKVFVQTGFEKDSIGKPPPDWEIRGERMEVTDDVVKTDKKSLGILGGADDDRTGVAIDTENPIISVEFWIYIKGGGRSFNLKVISSDNIAQNDGGAYINWNANAVRLFDGGAWQPIDDFETDTWKYVRVVSDISKSKFDFYTGDDRNEALKDRGKKGLPFRNAAVGPVAKWVAFHVYSIAAPGYVDDLLIYEGDEPLNLAVDPIGKLTTVWGHIKGHSTLR